MIFTNVIYMVIGYLVTDKFCLARIDETLFCFHVSPTDTIVQNFYLLPMILIFFSSSFGIFFFILLQFIDNCTSYYDNYDCCNNYLIPFTQRTVLDINNMETDEILFLKDLKEKNKSVKHIGPPQTQNSEPPQVICLK